MPKIQVLSQHIANRIAAGEVVERPASVVKELVENSIDAGADRISIEIEDGGLRFISVADNGSGIPSEDCTTAFLRHATSKISTSEDLEAIDTLGFRGEALASIASVAEVTLISSTNNSGIGARVCVDNGILGVKEECSCAKGTTIKVENLFLKVPARLKFVKSSRTEAGYVGDYVARAIMAHPNISIKYVSNGKVVYESVGDGDLKNAILCVYGVDVFNHLLPVSLDNGYMRIDGYVGDLDISRPNRNYQSFYINNRYIKSSALSGAVSRAYETKLTIGRFPVAIIKIQLSNREVDVNVHPAKIEVRFTDERRVCSCIFAACHNALSEQPVQNISPKPFQFHATMGKLDSGNFYRGESNITPSIEWSEHRLNEPSFGSAYALGRVDSPYREKAAPHFEYGAPLTMPRDDYKIIGCVFSTYWLVECNGELYVIDQHAAHERLLYEKLSSMEILISSQRLIAPKKLTLSASDYSLLTEKHELFEQIGFAWLNTGDMNTIEITFLPQLNGKLLDESHLFDCIGLIAEQDKDASLDLCRERLIQRSCKKAVKAGDILSHAEVEALMEEYSTKGVPLTCPHGRPVIIRITKHELERMFKRIQ